MKPASRPGQSEFVERCLVHVRDLPFVRRATVSVSGADREPSVDAQLSITTPQGTSVLPCEIKRTHLRNETAQLVIHAARRAPGLTVFAPAVGRELGEVFERAGVNFVDAAGNCHLNLADQYVARIQGRTAPSHAQNDRGLRAPAYRALFTLLVRPSLINAPSRAIAAEAEVSPQTANDVRRRLVEQGLVLETKKRHEWTPNRFKDARSLWLAGFTTSLSPSLMVGRFRARESEPDKLEQRIEPLLDATCEWRYGGGAAGLRLTGYYRGERTVLYTRDAPTDLATRLHLLRDASGPILLMRAPGRLAFESPDPRSVHPLLAYADLLAEGHDRARDAAGELYDKFLSAAEPTR
jgi:hypothetical protein